MTPAEMIGFTQRDAEWAGEFSRRYHEIAKADPEQIVVAEWFASLAARIAARLPPE